MRRPLHRLHNLHIPTTPAKIPLHPPPSFPPPPPIPPPPHPLHNLHIPTTPTKIPPHPPPYLPLRRLWLLIQKRPRRHHHPRHTIPTLIRPLRQKRLLHRTQLPPLR